MCDRDMFDSLGDVTDSKRYVRPATKGILSQGQEIGACGISGGTSALKPSRKAVLNLPAGASQLDL